MERVEFGALISEKSDGSSDEHRCDDVGLLVVSEWMKQKHVLWLAEKRAESGESGAKR